MEHHDLCFIKNVAYFFKKLRLLRRLCVEQVAAGAGLQEAALRRFEDGLGDFTSKTVNKLIRYYGISYTLVFKHYTTLPTRAQWQQLKLMQKEVIRYHKSKKRLTPQTGVQLELKF